MKDEGMDLHFSEVTCEDVVSGTDYQESPV